MIINEIGFWKINFTINLKHLTNVLCETIGVEKFNNIFINVVKVLYHQPMVIKRVLVYNSRVIKTMAYV